MFETLILTAFVSTFIALLVRPFWRLNLSHPFALYVSVFAIYEFGSIAVWAFTEDPPDTTRWAVLGMALLALFGVAIGIHLGHRKEWNSQGWDNSRPVSVLGPCILTLLLVVATGAHYGILISQGHINTHVSAYTIQTTIFDSIFVVFTSQGRFAAILMLGFIHRSAESKYRPLILKSLIGYTVLLEILFFMNSETRPALTAAVCFLIAWRYAVQRNVPVRLLLPSALAILIGAAVIQQVRLFDLDTIRLSDSPLAAASGALVEGASRLVEEGGSSGADVVQSRITDGARMTAMIWEQTALGHGHMNGGGLWYSLRSMAPRVLFPTKEKVDPLDIFTERALGLAEFDGCLTSFGYAFAEAGWLGILLLHVVLGLVLAVATREATARISPVWWLTCAFSWEVALQMENELLSEGLSALRAIAVYGVILSVIAVISRRRIARKITKRDSRPQSRVQVLDALAESAGRG